MKDGRVMSVLTRSFPAAMRAINALEPAHRYAPTKVKNVAALLEEAMQAYGRCMLASAGTPVTSSCTTVDGRVVKTAARDVAVFEAEDHMLWRSRLRNAIDQVAVGGNVVLDRAVSAVTREIDHLMYTLDRVLAVRNIHCSTVASGVHS